MHRSFDSDVPWHVALALAQGRKKVGRKHKHQPRGRAIERRKRMVVRRNKQNVIDRAAFSAKVAAYFRGEVENYPRLTTGANQYERRTTRSEHMEHRRR